MESYAIKSSESMGRFYPEKVSLNRTPFQRDRDRILHSGSFRKLQYKTQVFLEHEGDYYRTRLTHTLEVMQVARTISYVLGVNSDLVEAIALAHDLGHPPFGHTGELELNRLMIEFGGFDHNIQALRIVTQLEKIYANHPGLNLTFETLEGMITHNGPLATGTSFGSKFFERMGHKFSKFPSIESQIAAISDDIAYTCHDIGDGLRAGLFSLKDISRIPILSGILKNVEAKHNGIKYKTKCHEIVRSLLNLLISDLLAESDRRLKPLKGLTSHQALNHNQKLIALTSDKQEALKMISQFLFKNMYRHSQISEMRKKCLSVIQDLFILYSENPSLLPDEWGELASQACHKALVRIVSDYISGMTDRYALNEHNHHFG